ncbi:MAG: hypothetical protein ACOYB0_08435 [Polynucleobacter sp.]
MTATIINADLSVARAALAEFADAQLPFAIASTLNAAANGTRRNWRAIAKQRIDKPKRFTLDALTIVSRATKRRLVVEMAFGPKQRDYLRPSFEGGERGRKAIETLAGAPRGVPSKAVERDAAGNVPRKVYSAIYSRLLARDKSIVRDPPGVAPGIYLRKGRTFVPLFFTVPHTAYAKRFDMDADIVAVTRRELSKAAPKAIERALLTANREAAKLRRDAAKAARATARAARATAG